MKVTKYSENLKDSWNKLIEQSKQGTFLLNRNYMDYHSHKFIDHSLMLYNQKNILMAVLPANIKDGDLFSHQGLTYGGLIYSKSLKLSDVLLCFDSLRDYCQSNGINHLIYKRVPDIFHLYPADEDLYALFLQKAKLLRRDAGFAIAMKDRIKIRERKVRFINSVKDKYSIKESQDYEKFFEIMRSALGPHGVLPVHTSQELQLLTEGFPNNIKLYGAFNSENHMVAGLWLFITKNTVHIQYGMVSEQYKKDGVMDCLYGHIINDMCKDYEYLSFGISTEQEGIVLNKGLTSYKESLGARTIAHDFYKITF